MLQNSKLKRLTVAKSKAENLVNYVKDVGEDGVEDGVETLWIFVRMVCCFMGFGQTYRQMDNGDCGVTFVTENKCIIYQYVGI